MRTHSTWSMKSKSIWNMRAPSAIGEVVSPRAVTVERDVPGMIEPGRARQSYFADHLRPQLQRGGGVRPGGVGQFGPGGVAAIIRAPCNSSQASPRAFQSHTQRHPTGLVASTANYRRS